LGVEFPQVQEPADLCYNNAHSLCHNGILCNVGIRNVSKQLLYEELTHCHALTLIGLTATPYQQRGVLHGESFLIQNLRVLCELQTTDTFVTCPLVKNPISRRGY
jgi:hypothetical protein